MSEAKTLSFGLDIGGCKIEEMVSNMVRANLVFADAWSWGSILQPSPC